ncbi:MULTISPECIES: DnaA regulatory inactivator Hda [Pseudoxanthomonas]|jgi:DnaA family protein|uniref:DnaA regulatory inactivator Hda n=1 Tax=Pseudoxanthomonas winnipegensis TaxID=2480810 RepID=A0A4Q8L8K1_9GAMM|nr:MULTISPECIES: DnaA regulatory inactivator Hda [Pseudoxanthomonas]PZP58857.1 MAG: DnaA regulatory inactivator Hda [Pseudoxanthomonas spadix]TAA24584.1 DnaA regulatory inactivator Hda [Pseudoxanthomonas winnipegensis]TMN20003.1 DnaA regulatory inactivator Hda [Pseudoxanthomonas sp. X-1]UAY76118.1 DnaA regulatory inactivator Hda [Pseudoxanthomonas sp. X-1]
MSVPQLPLALRTPSDQRFESFIGAPAGALAQLQALARAPEADWLYVAAAHGAGKTHLALAACAAAGESGRQAAYLPLKAAAGHLQQALDGLERNALVALDGLEAIAGDRADEIALFDFHNRARAAGIGVLYTAADVPDALGLVLPDLRSRLGQCARIVLRALDDGGRAALLRDRAARRGLVLEDAAVDWMLTRTVREPAQLVDLIERLDRASLAAKRRVTVPFLRQVLADE